MNFQMPQAKRIEYYLHWFYLTGGTLFKKLFGTILTSSIKSGRTYQLKQWFLLNH